MRKLSQSWVLLLLFGILPFATFGGGGKTAAGKLSADGPYILHQADGSARVVGVNVRGEIQDTTYAALPKDFGFEVVSHDKKHRFQVALHPVERPQWKFGQPEKLFVMSDPHGNLDCVVSLLRGNGIIDKSYRWSYGKNRVVVIGDIFDRGKDVLQIFWLFYKLEAEAAAAGGQVDFLLGNHEPMVLMNDLRYTDEKYKVLADTLGMTYPELFGRTTELGNWLCTRNTMQLVGRNLFVHGGLSKPFLEQNLEIPTVNEEMSRGLYLKKKERQEASPLIYFLFASDGPIWYRGAVLQKEKYHPLAADTLDLILQRYDADRMIVGHTIFEDISSFYDGKVVAVNVDNAKNRKEKRGRGIVIEQGVIYVVGDKGKMRVLK